MAAPDNSPNLKRVLHSYKTQAMNSLQGPGAAHHFVEYGKGLLEDPSSGGGGGCPPPYYYTHKKKHYEDFALKKSSSESCHKCEDSSSEELTPPPAQCSASEAPWHSSSLPGRPNHHHQRGQSPPQGAPLQGCDDGEKRRTEKCESEAVVIVKGGLKKAAGPSSSPPSPSPSSSSPPTPSPSSSSTLPPTSSSSSSSTSSFGEDKCDLKVQPQQPPPFPPEERERGVPSSAPATPRCQLVKSEDPAAEPPPRERAPPNYKWVEPPTFLAPAPFPPQPLPVLASADPGVVPPSQRRSETLLDGNLIACFTIGGEPRLCLPQILNTVLRHFSLPQINAVCDELQIFCSRCTPRQLEYLKDSGVLPPTATSSGLITKTDAQRLTHALLYAHVSRPPPKKVLHAHDKSQQIRISHSCFGKCKGAIWPEVYNAPQDLCIVCLECNNLYSPTQFVCHAHRAVENRTCHWGFDAENWRDYIRLSKDQVLPMHKAELHLQQFKNKFDPSHSGNHKRKQGSDVPEELVKKVKGEDLAVYSTGGLGFNSELANYLSWGKPPAWAVVPMVTKDGKSLPLPSAVFAKESIPSQIPSYLSQGPPVLVDPGRVVPMSECEKFERNFQPNVALAPPKVRDKMAREREALELERFKVEQQQQFDAGVGVVYQGCLNLASEKDSKLSLDSRGGVDPLVVKDLEPETKILYVKMEAPPSSPPHSRALQQQQQQRPPSLGGVFKQEAPLPRSHCPRGDPSPPSSEGYPPDLVLSTTDSDTESISSVTSKSEFVEEAEALMRGWTDRAAAKKVLDLVALLARLSSEKDLQLEEAHKQRIRLHKRIQTAKSEHQRIPKEEKLQEKMSLLGKELRESRERSALCYRVKKEPFSSPD